MLTKEKIEAVKKQLRSGEPEGEIKIELQNEGYTEEEINTIFTPHKYDMSGWYLFFGVAFILAGIYFFVSDKEYWLHVLLTGVALIVVDLSKERKRKQRQDQSS